MRARSMAKELQGTVKEILGTCVSVGCTVDGKDPKDLQQEIADGDEGYGFICLLFVLFCNSCFSYLVLLYHQQDFICLVF
ncbi:putative ribosomal protein L11/L12 [Helianthus debilis subsp. tardiflorus]